MSQVSKWGNSLAVRIPRGVAEAMGLHDGDDVTMEFSRRGRELVMRKTPASSSQEEQARAFEDLEALRRRLQLDVVFDRDAANEMDRFDQHGR